MGVMDSYNIMQTLQDPTRAKNTLDQVFTNEAGIFTQKDLARTFRLDHDLIKLSTNTKDNANLLSNSENNTQIKETALC